MLALARGPAGVSLLVLSALLEATVFPGPTEALLIALVLAKRNHAWRLGAIATMASVTGAAIGYAMGDALYGTVALPLIERFDLLSDAEALSNAYRDNAFIALGTSGYTPVPFMLYTMVGGASGVPWPTFLAGVLVGRALKYLPIAGLAWLFGPAVYRIVQRHGWWVVLVVTVALVIAYIFSR